MLLHLQFITTVKRLERRAVWLILNNALLICSYIITYWCKKCKIFVLFRSLSLSSLYEIGLKEVRPIGLGSHVSSLLLYAACIILVSCIRNKLIRSKCCHISAKFSDIHWRTDRSIDIVYSCCFRLLIERPLSYQETWYQVMRYQSQFGYLIYQMVCIFW